MMMDILREWTRKWFDLGGGKSTDSRQDVGDGGDDSSLVCLLDSGSRTLWLFTVASPQL